MVNIMRAQLNSLVLAATLAFLVAGTLNQTHAEPVAPPDWWDPADVYFTFSGSIGGNDTDVVVPFRHPQLGGQLPGREWFAWVDAPSLGVVMTSWEGYDPETIRFNGFLALDTDSSPISPVAPALNGIIRPDGAVYICISSQYDTDCDRDGGGPGVAYTFYLAFQPLPDVSEVDGCDIADSSLAAADIYSLAATYVPNGANPALDAIMLDLVICDREPNSRVKYQIFMDHTPPLYTVDGRTDDRNGDGRVRSRGNKGDFCANTADDVVTLLRNKVRGPGSLISETPTTIATEEGDIEAIRLTFEVLVDDLRGARDEVHIWAATQRSRVIDRAPNTADGDGCDEPEVTTEVISLSLVE